MRITSHYKMGPLGLPRGPVIPVGESVELDDDRWDWLKDHPTVAVWLEAGVITAGDSEPVEKKSRDVDPPEDDDDADEKPNVDNVLEMASDGTPFATFKAEAAKLLGDDTPSKKADIVAALHELKEE